MVKKCFVTLNVKTKETFDFVYFAKFLSTSTSCAYLSGISCSIILLYVTYQQKCSDQLQTEFLQLF